jgi:hypothetical protein
LLEPQNSFEAMGMSSAEFIFTTLPWKAARPLALDFDTSPVADPAQRASLDDWLFLLRALPDPSAPAYDDQVPPNE